MLQREGLTCQQFVASNLITLFTSNYSPKNSAELTRWAMDFMMFRGWEGFLGYFIAIIKVLEEYFVFFEMEDILFFWDSFFKSDQV